MDKQNLLPVIDSQASVLATKADQVPQYIGKLLIAGVLPRGGGRVA
jgi:hypothetical protein